MMIYVVTRSGGEYDDAWEEPAQAFNRKAAAEEFARLMNEEPANQKVWPNGKSYRVIEYTVYEAPLQ